MADAEAIFRCYASDAELLQFVAWDWHRSVEDTRQFLAYSDREWESWPVGPLLVENRHTGELLGSTGLAFETRYRASTGYVLARTAWGRGYATEALEAVALLAARFGVQRLYALCHAEHAASRNVLKRCAFEYEGTLRKYAPFPNHPVPGLHDVACYSDVNVV